MRRACQAIAAAIGARLRPAVFLPVLGLALVATWYGLGPSLDRFALLTGGQVFVDMQPGLTPEALVAQLGAYGPAAVRYYLWWSLFDVAWPFLSYTAMLFMAAWLARRLGPAWQGRLWLLVAVAYTTVLLDWGENAGFVGLVLAAPGDNPWLATAAVLLHRGKLACNGIFNLGFLALLGAVSLRLARPAR